MMTDWLVCSCRETDPYVHVSCTGMFAPSSIPPQGEGEGALLSLTVQLLSTLSRGPSPRHLSLPASSLQPAPSSPSASQHQPTEAWFCWPWIAPHPSTSFSTPSHCCWEWGVNKTMCGLMMEWFEGCVLRAASLFTGRINQNYGL